MAEPSKALMEKPAFGKSTSGLDFGEPSQPSAIKSDDVSTLGCFVDCNHTYKGGFLSFSIVLAGNRLITKPYTVVIVGNVAWVGCGIIVAVESGKSGGVEVVAEEVIGVLHTSIVLEFCFSVD